MATTPKSDEEAEHRDREQQHLHGLGDQQDQHQVRLLQPGDLGLGLQVGALVDQPPRGRREGRVGGDVEEGLDRDVVVELVELLVEPHHQEAHGRQAEEQHGAPDDAAGMAEVTCQTSVLMNRNVTKMQQHRQRPGRQREQQPQAGERALERPAGDLVHAQREQRVRRRPRRPRATRRPRTRTTPTRSPAHREPTASRATSATSSTSDDPRAATAGAVTSARTSSTKYGSPCSRNQVSALRAAASALA